MQPARRTAIKIILQVQKSSNVVWFYETNMRWQHISLQLWRVSLLCARRFTEDIAQEVHRHPQTSTGHRQELQLLGQSVWEIIRKRLKMKSYRFSICRRI
jgi:hypothetical protein